MILQAAVPADLYNLLLKAAELLITGAVGYLAREFGKMRQEMTEWRVHLFGINGDNGLSGDVKKLKRVVFKEDA